MGKHNFYTVTVGKNTGVFDDWLKVTPLVVCVSGSSFKGYKTMEAAQEAYDNAVLAGTVRIVSGASHTAVNNASSTAHVPQSAPVRRRDDGDSPVPSPIQRSASQPTVVGAASSRTVMSPFSTTLADGSSPLRTQSQGIASPSKYKRTEQTPPPAPSNHIQRIVQSVPATAEPDETSSSYVTALEGYSSNEDIKVSSISTRITARAKGKQREIPFASQDIHTSPAFRNVTIRSSKKKPKKEPELLLGAASRKKKAFPPEQPGVTRRVFQRVPDELKPYPDDIIEIFDSDEEADLLSPLSSPQLPVSAMECQSDMMSSLSLTASVGMSPVITNYLPKTAVDPRSPMAKNSSLPRSARLCDVTGSRPSPKQVWRD